MQMRSNTNTNDELFSSGKARPGLGELSKYLKSKTQAELNALRHDAELTIRSFGISFTVYSEGQNIDREWPFDIIPRTIMRKEWNHIEKGLVQRLRALNTFIDDVYNDSKIIKDKVVPAELLKTSKKLPSDL
jgi:uncharacterized circularly permuted ATP-grasp superfamily protein